MPGDRSIRTTLESISASAEIPDELPASGWILSYVTRPGILVAAAVLLGCVVALWLADAELTRARLWYQLGLHGRSWRLALQVPPSEARQRLLLQVYRAEAARGGAGSVLERLMADRQALARIPWWATHGEAGLQARILLPRYDALLAGPVSPEREECLLELLETPLPTAGGDAVRFGDLHPWGRREVQPGEPFWVRYRGDGRVVRQGQQRLQAVLQGSEEEDQVELALWLLQTSVGRGRQRESLWEALLHEGRSLGLAGISADWWLEVWQQVLEQPSSPEWQRQLQELLEVPVMQQNGSVASLWEARVAGALVRGELRGQVPGWIELGGASGVEVQAFLHQLDRWPLGRCRSREAPDDLWERTWAQVHSELQQGLRAAGSRGRYQDLLELPLPATATRTVLGRLDEEFAAILPRLPAASRHHHGVLLYLAAVELAATGDSVPPPRSASRSRLWRSRATVLRQGHTPVLFSIGEPTCVRCGTVRSPVPGVWRLEDGGLGWSRDPDGQLVVPPVTWLPAGGLSFLCAQQRFPGAGTAQWQWRLQARMGRRGGESPLPTSTTAWGCLGPGTGPAEELASQLPLWPWGACARYLEDASDLSLVESEARREADRWVPAGALGGIGSLSELVWTRAGEVACSEGLAASALEERTRRLIARLAGTGVRLLVVEGTGPGLVSPPELEVLGAYRLGHLGVQRRTGNVACLICGRITGPAPGISEAAGGELRWSGADGSVVTVPPWRAVGRTGSGRPPMSTRARPAAPGE